ncbi:hypothetical protein [Acuticoccus sediminis]|uniref:hypothetical protein n=1 Tax=Acuticoccus sediminis TaxID=2184697 RepID=UPI001CFE1E36|nr:hypothetical protein [Acuticoccus sediminis]
MAQTKDTPAEQPDAEAEAAIAAAEADRKAAAERKAAILTEKAAKHARSLPPGVDLTPYGTAATGKRKG